VCAEWDGGEELDFGSPGASAKAEFERRRANDDRRRQEVFGRFLAPLIKAMTGEKLSTAAWDRGGRGEERVGTYLSEAVGHIGLVLHDRVIPGSRSNIDHIAVVPSGVWVIDTKRYVGRIQRRDLGGWFRPCPALFVNGRDRTALVPAVLHQVTRVRGVAGTRAAVHGVLCFDDSEWGALARPFVIDDVTVTWPKRLAKSLRVSGPLDERSFHTLAAQIAHAFPSYRTPRSLPRWNNSPGRGDTRRHSSRWRARRPR
jgi:Nuclease-related domain